MKVQAGVRARLCGVAFLMALAAGCGGGDGGEAGLSPGPGAPSAPPAGPPAQPEVRGWAQPFGSAAVVLGQSGFDQLDPGGGPATPIPGPLGRPAVTLDGQLLAPAGGGSVSTFANYEATNGAVASAQFAIRDEVQISDLSMSDTKLVVSGLFRVWILNSVPAGGIVDPDVSAGTGFPGCSESSLEQLTAAVLTPDGKRLIVADANNHRILIWNDVDQATGSLGNAAVVLGQEAMNTCQPNADQAPSSATLNQPRSVWSNGHMLIVADTGNNRLLIWNDIENVGDFQSADVVIGQQNDSEIEPNRGQATPSAISFASPGGVDVSAQGELAVTDTNNSRVLVWRRIPTSADQSADVVVGQSDFAHGASNDPGQTGQDGTTLSAKTLAFPQGARFHGRNLIVNDNGNNRVLVWRESD